MCCILAEIRLTPVSDLSMHPICVWNQLFQLHASLARALLLAARGRKISKTLCAGDWLRESEDAKAKLESAETELEAARTGRAQADEKIEKLQQYMQVTRALRARRVRRGDLTCRGWVCRGRRRR